MHLSQCPSDGRKSRREDGARILNIGFVPLVATSIVAIACLAADILLLLSLALEGVHREGMGKCLSWHRGDKGV
ncbi:hypothetical protein AOLI_G00161980 [Acnodon oligacanthus]